MRLLPDPIYNPMNQDEITSSTKLAPGVSMATFLGSPGNRSSFDYRDARPDNKRRMAKYLYLHAELMRGFNLHPEFKNHKLVPIESIGETELGNSKVDQGINYLKWNGETVVYEVYNNAGQVDCAKTFDLAVYWKDHVIYNRLRLSYDTFNPDGSMNAQIVFTVPGVSDWYKLLENPDFVLETYYNESIQASNELLELVAE